MFSNHSFFFKRDTFNVKKLNVHLNGSEVKKGYKHFGNIPFPPWKQILGLTFHLQLSSKNVFKYDYLSCFKHKGLWLKEKEKDLILNRVSL